MLPWIEYISQASIVPGIFTKNGEILELFENEVKKYNEKFSQYERVKKFVLLGRPWSPSGGELTATLKLKRRNILEKYSDLYRKIFEKNE